MSNATLQSPGGKVDCLGQFIANTELNDKTLPLRFYVVGQTENLLSRDAAIKFGLFQHTGNVNNLAFEEVGTPVDTDPIKITLETQNRIAFQRREESLKIEAKLKRMEENGVIEKITDSIPQR